MRFAWVVLLSLLPTVAGAKAPWHDDLAARLDRHLKASKLPAAGFGMHVSYQEIGVDVPLWQVNSEKPFIPASITKLVTAAAALTQYPIGHQYLTQLYGERLPDGETLKGALYLKGGGDPAFVSEDMWVLVNEFTRNRVRRIEGDIVVDDTLFDAERFDAGRDPDRVDRAYDSPIGALSFNWNAVNVYVRPGTVGEPPRVFVDPETTQFEVVNKAKTVRGDKRQIAVDRETVGDKEVITITGLIGLSAPEAVVYKSINRPDLWTGEHLRTFLAQRGIVVTGRVRAGATPASALLMAETKSKPLAYIVADMMKWSNNFVAEMLTKGLSAAAGERPATMRGGLAQTGAYLRSLSIPDDKYFISSPSGLSRKNRFRPRDLHAVLNQVHRNFQVMPEYLMALPMAGVDGTLRERMKKGPANGWVRAKTGLLTGVVALAGFAGRPDGTVFTFVFIFNGTGEQTWAARDTLDVLASALVMGK